MLPLRSRSAVDRAVPDARRLTTLLEQVGDEGCYLHTTESGGSEAVAYTRFFTPIVGIAEDPATGRAAGPLAAAP